MITASRYHDFSCGHRVVGHESKCAHLHGHNYRVHFEVVAETPAPWQQKDEDAHPGKPYPGFKGLDALGRVMDFSVIKSLLCEWLEDNWDHKFLAWEEDKVMLELDNKLKDMRDWTATLTQQLDNHKASQSVVWVPFNPTAENMADYLLRVVGPQQLAETGIQLVQVTVEETRKCSATAVLGGLNVK